jgi:hypothetical protein
VVDSEGSLIVSVDQILEELPNHHRAQHALVHDGPVAEGADIEVIPCWAHCCCLLALDQLAHNEQLTLKVVANLAGLALNHHLRNISTARHSTTDGQA